MLSFDHQSSLPLELLKLSHISHSLAIRDCHFHEKGRVRCRNIQKWPQKRPHKKVALFIDTTTHSSHKAMKLAEIRTLARICTALKYKNDKDIIITHFLCLFTSFLGFWFSHPILSLSVSFSNPKGKGRETYGYLLLSKQDQVSWSKEWERDSALCKTQKPSRASPFSLSPKRLKINPKTLSLSLSRVCFECVYRL